LSRLPEYLSAQLFAGAEPRHLKAGQTLFVRRCRAPWSLDDGKLNGWNGGRGVYFKDLNGHLLELMTVPQ
jgi:hypothetical protein